MSTFALPDLGEGLTEAEVVQWHVSVGDRVVADQPLLSVETDKAVVEIPAPHAGTIGALHAAVHDVVPIGAPLCDIEAAAGADAGAVVGDLPTDAAPRPATRPPKRKDARKSRPPAHPVAAGRAMPAVRRLAQRLGIDLADLADRGGSGPGGVVTGADLEAAASKAPKGYVPLRGTRRSMARAMARSNAEVAATTVTDEADIGDWQGGSDPMARLVRAVVRACTAEPALNAWFHGASTSRRLHDRVDLGLAVDTPDGLIVPVLRDAGGRPGPELRPELDRLRTGAAERTLTPAELREPTLTLSNFGMLGGRHAHLAIVPPQVAIVGAGRIEPRVVARGGKAAARTVVPLSITFDHRAVTGGEAARFLAAMIADLQEPE